MNFDNHMNGWMFHHPKGIPYYHHDNLSRVAMECDTVRCNRTHAEHWDHDCFCFIHYSFSLGNIVQVSLFDRITG